MSARLRILYVEPHSADVDLTRSRFETSAPHLSITAVESGDAALSRLAARDGYDLVLTDLRMPGMSGLDLFTEARKRGVELPFVVITGRGDEGSAVAALRLGIADYVVKRDDYLLRLPHVLEAAFARSELARTNARLRMELEHINAHLERKVADRTEELRAAKEHLAVTLSSIGDGVIVTDTSGVITGMNAAAERLTGWDEAAALGRQLGQVFRIFDADTRAVVEDPTRLVIERGEIRGLANHTVLVARDGVERHISDNASPIRDRNGRVIGVVLVFRDVSDEYAARAALARSERMLREITEAFPGPVSRVDADGRYVYVSESCERVYGVSRQSALGRLPSEVLDPVFYARVEPFVRRARGGERVSFEGVMTRADGEQTHTEITLIPDAEGGGYYTVGMDITGLVRSEEAQRALVAEKEALLKEVHHRVKNNLQIISSLLRLEARRIEGGRVRSALNDMQGRIASMALLHENLYRAGRFADVNLATYLTQLATQLVRSLSAIGQIALRLDLVPVHCGIDQAIPCGLIVNELISNCLRHAFPQGRVGEIGLVLRATGNGDEIAVVVRDNGVGLPPDTGERRRQSLGLQLVSDLARQLGGALIAGPGPEAVFETRFVPALSAAAEPAVPDRRPTVGWKVAQ